MMRAFVERSRDLKKEALAKLRECVDLMNRGAAPEIVIEKLSSAIAVSKAYYASGSVNAP